MLFFCGVVDRRCIRSSDSLLVILACVQSKALQNTFIFFLEKIARSAATLEYTRHHLDRPGIYSYKLQ